MAVDDGQVAAIAARLRVLEDESEIRRLVSAYGPAVDSGQAERAAQLWTESGAYDVGMAVWEGHDAIIGMVHGEAHQGLIAHGVAHILGVPHIVVDGDRAVATCYSRVFRHLDGVYETWRVAANRWELARTEEGWRATRRTTRLLNGSDEARQLLARAGEF
jgi:hypothetical protein